MEKNTDRLKRVQGMVQLTLTGTQTRFMSTKEATDNIAKRGYFSEGKEGVKERALFIKLLNKRKRRVTLIVTLDFNKAIGGKGAVALNVQEALIHAVNTVGLAPESEEAFTKTITIITEEGVPLEHNFLK